MGLLRFLALALLTIVVLRLLRTLVALVAAPPPRAGGGPRPPDPRNPGRGPERLVEDPVCGVRLPESRAIRDGDRFFCSEECRGRFLPSA
jgi:hypothetical protein